MGEEQHTIKVLTELTGQEGGRWQVVTVHSEHRFDPDAETVVRAPGEDARTFGDDGRTRLPRTIEQCRVGERGYWTMYSSDFLVDVEWHRSTDIVRITPLPEQTNHDGG